MNRPVVLIIMDGLGISSDREGNAVAAARKPVLDILLSKYPSTELGASAGHVGLPDGQMGNSEVGHLNIGAGRIVYQDFTRITKAIRNGELSTNPALLKTMAETKRSGGALHLMGLLSDGGVHSHMDHLFALIDLAAEQKIERLCVHAFMDGRDTPPRSGRTYLEALEDHLKKRGVGRIATVMGRFYAMDRDNRWDRIEAAYGALTGNCARTATSALEALERSYAEEKGDEFVPPTIIVSKDNKTAPLVNEDGVIFFNFRADRAREITRALTDDAFEPFANPVRIRPQRYVCMTEYDRTLGLPAAFPPGSMKNLLGELVGRAGIKQLRIAETEKYAHVTFFFNGGIEQANPGEERILIPSPKEVKTYDEKPVMSAFEVTEAVIEKLDEGQFGLVVINFANCDMVGHTGVMSAAVEAVETVDASVGRVVNAALRQGACVFITADHGNAEQMIDKETKQPHTAHTTNPVPFIAVGEAFKGRRLRKGILADIAPTILEVLGMEKPVEMDGRSLFEPL